MKKFAIITFLMFSSAFVQSQIPSVLYPEKIDSLHLRLKTADGTEKVDALNDLALHLAPRYFDSSMSYAGEALRLAENLDYSRGKGMAKFNIGNSYYFRMDAKNALIYYFKALWILEDLGPSQDLGNLYCQIAEFTNGLENNQKAFHIFKYTNNRASQKYVRLKIANNMGSPGDSMYLQNLSYFRNINDKDGLFQTLLDLSANYFYKKKPEGLAYAEEALKVAGELRNNWMMANACHKIANYYENIFNVPELKTDYVMAEHYLLKALELLNTNETYQYELIAETYRELGFIKMSQKKSETALGYFTKGIAFNVIFLNAFDTITFQEPALKNIYWGMGNGNLAIIYSMLHQIYLDSGDFEKAYKFIHLADSMGKHELIDRPAQQIAVMQANFEYEKSCNKVDLLTRENELNQLRLSRSRIWFAGTGGIMLITFLIILLWFQRKRYKSEQKTLILEQKLLRSQMNPHFLFNSLTSIQNFIVSEKPDAASIYLSKFSKLVRNILDNSIEEYVPLEKEIRAIENYIELQKLRWAGKFDYRIKIAPEIDDENIMIPPMLAQPFIENAIEHGVKHRETPGFIDIRFTRIVHSIIFEVEDNGVGREKAREYEMLSNQGHCSMATSITKERLVALNKKRRRKITLHITDLKSESGEAAGTLVRFGIPILNISR